MKSEIDLSKWGKCHICGRNAVVAVELCFGRLRRDGTMSDASHRRMMDPDHPFLCEDHRHVLATFGRQLVIPSQPDARGEVTTRYPFTYEGYYVTITEIPGASPAGPVTVEAVARPSSSKTRSLWPDALGIPIPAIPESAPRQPANK